MPEADRTFARSLDTWFHKSITYRYIYTYIYYNVLNDIDTRLLKEESPQNNDVSRRTGAFASSLDKAKVLMCSAYCFIKY